MLQSLSKLKESIEKLTQAEVNKLKIIQEKLQKFIADKKYEKGIEYAITTLMKMKSEEGQTLQNCVKHEIVKIYNSYIIYLINTDPNKNVKKYFIEVDQYIGNNIFSYLIKQNNYSCYLVQNNHIKQSKNILTKIKKIELVNYLSKNQGSFDQISKSYSNLSSIENNMKSYQESLVLGMESLALSQFDLLFNNNTNSQIYLCYYSIGAQQEYLKRNEDAKSSLAQSKKYLNEEGGNLNQYEFIKKIKSDKNDINIINFKESLNNPELTYLKCKKFDPFSQSLRLTNKNIGQKNNSFFFEENDQSVNKAYNKDNDNK